MDFSEGFREINRNSCHIDDAYAIGFYWTVFKMRISLYNMNCTAWYNLKQITIR
jgi:hypothetical protein